jgi:hypothetical protein
LTYNASRGSHRNAVHQHATQVLHPQTALSAVGFQRSARRFAGQSLRLPGAAAAASWIGFLLSAVSEYGFDLDFPLTPPLWLVIAIITLVAQVFACPRLADSALPVFARAQTINNRTHGSGQWKTCAYWCGSASSLSDSVSFISNPDASRPSAPVGNCRATPKAFGVAIDPAGGISASGGPAVQVSGCLTTSEAMQPAIFLHPMTNRGPPRPGDGTESLFARTTVPAPQFRAAPRTSGSDLPSISPIQPIAMTARSSLDLNDAVSFVLGMSHPPRLFNLYNTAVSTMKKEKLT